MTAPRTTSVPLDVRARMSGGRSNDAIYRMVSRALAARGIRDATLIDVGCGRGDLSWHVGPFVRRYVGLDAVRYDGWPAGAEFRQVDLDECTACAEFEGLADVVAAVETIEHLENPRKFCRMLVRLARPGGWIVVTTPNQMSALSLLTLVVKGRFSQFRDSHYPAHITALLPVDLRRIASEVGLSDVAIEYSGVGRIVFTDSCYPSWLAKLSPRACSDNVLVVGRRID